MPFYSSICDKAAWILFALSATILVTESPTNGEDSCKLGEKHTKGNGPSTMLRKTAFLTFAKRKYSHGNIPVGMLLVGAHYFHWVSAEGTEEDDVSVKGCWAGQLHGFERGSTSLDRNGEIFLGARVRCAFSCIWPVPFFFGTECSFPGENRLGGLFWRELRRCGKEQCWAVWISIGLCFFGPWGGRNG